MIAGDRRGFLLRHDFYRIDYYACMAGRWAHYSPEKK
jgi:hypothetical protein